MARIIGKSENNRGEGESCNVEQPEIDSRELSDRFSRDQTSVGSSDHPGRKVEVEGGGAEGGEVIEVENANVVDRPGEQLFDSRRRTRSDAKLVERAIREGWPVNPEHRERAVEVAAELLEDSDQKFQVAGTRLMLMADKMNIEKAKLEIQKNGQSIGGGITINGNVGISLDDRRGRILEILSAVHERVGDSGSGNAVVDRPGD